MKLSQIARSWHIVLVKSFNTLSERNKSYVLSLLVGICSGLAAVLLSKFIDWIRAGLNLLFPEMDYNWSFLFFPAIGMLLAFLFVKFLVKDNIGHGVTKVLQAVSRNDSRIKAHNMWSSVISSSLTIGFGGSVGAEAPIVYTGAAIGSNFANYMGMSYRGITTMIGCGAAGAVAGIFKAPLAGVLFTMEILLFNISMSTMVPLLLSSVSATVVSYIFLGTDTPFRCSLTAFSMGNIPFYIVLGIIAGFGSLYFMRTTLRLEDRIGRLGKPWLKWILCSVGLGMLIFLFPMLYGEGYSFLGSLLDGDGLSFPAQKTPLSFLLNGGWGVPLFFLLVFFLKVVAMSLTNAGGGVGGTFGPTLFAGAILGFVIARSINILFETTAISVPEQNFVLVGMAALMAGVMQAPLTAIFLIAEISGGYDLFIPLIISATLSFATVRVFEKYSIYTKRLAQSGELLTHDSDQAVLTLLKTKDLIRDKYPRLNIDSPVKDVIPVISESAAAVFPVVDDEGHFQGLLDMDNVRKHLFKESEYRSLYVYNLMEQPLAFVFENDSMESVMNKFDKTAAWRLPVVTDDMKYLGFISKSRILMAYREELKIISQD